jgi:hypothetical protein
MEGYRKVRNRTQDEGNKDMEGLWDEGRRMKVIKI